MSKEQAQRFVEITSHPKEQSEFLSERKLFYEICLYIALNNNLKGLLSHRLYDELEKDSVLKKKIDIYITKYFFSKTDFYNYQILSTESVLKDVGRGLQEHTLQDIKKELQKLNFQKLKIEKTKQKLLEKYSLNQLDKKNILFAQSITREGDTRKTSMMTQLYYIFTLIDKIASLKGITYQQIANLTPEEVEDLLQGKKFSDKHYEKRENTVVLYEPRKKRTCFYGTDADDLFKAMNDFLLSDKEIKGNVASKGYSNKNLQTGVVRILTDPINEQFYKGEILVTTMTRIEFVPIMKKAAAIITDEGGIASHAAVVSRELGIPCIVGTKVATKRLKTGDFVEMNLKTGVVRKIKYELKKNEF
ncbi:MAG: hypothetical protein KKB65_08540 [Nanoarchaeota archaeon]|nr:hypothetical protein [Nanoarchaeota archaeon]MBU1031257.1 hypothetical protein [Nanoarchaeota archaeon]MBU1849598.1 hypothetical protein [Nanoarchaeota archaeon]